MKWCWKQHAVRLNVFGVSFCPVFPNARGACCGVTGKKMSISATCLLICSWLFPRSVRLEESTQTIEVGGLLLTLSSCEGVCTTTCERPGRCALAADDDPGFAWPLCPPCCCFACWGGLWPPCGNLQEDWDSHLKQTSRWHWTATGPAPPHEHQRKQRSV